MASRHSTLPTSNQLTCSTESSTQDGRGRDRPVSLSLGDPARPVRWTALPGGNRHIQRQRETHRRRGRAHHRCTSQPSAAHHRSPAYRHPRQPRRTHRRDHTLAARRPEQFRDQLPTADGAKGDPPGSVKLRPGKPAVIKTLNGKWVRLETADDVLSAYARTMLTAALANLLDHEKTNVKP